MKISVEIDGVASTVAAFDKVQDGVADLRKLNIWLKVRQAFYKVEKEIFASEGAAGKGGKWKGLSSPYKEIKQAKYGNKLILQAGGGMYKEFTSSPGSVEEQAQEMSLSFSQPAGYHMSKGPRTKMPYRSSLDMTDEQKDQIVEPIRKGLRQLIDNAKLGRLRGF